MKGPFLIFFIDLPSDQLRCQGTVGTAHRRSGARAESAHATWVVRLWPVGSRSKAGTRQHRHGGAVTTQPRQRGHHHHGHLHPLPTRDSRQRPAPARTGQRRLRWSKEVSSHDRHCPWWLLGAAVATNQAKHGPHAESNTGSSEANRGRSPRTPAVSGIARPKQRWILFGHLKTPGQHKRPQTSSVRQVLHLGPPGPLRDKLADGIHAFASTISLDTFRSLKRIQTARYGHKRRAVALAKVAGNRCYPRTTTTAVRESLDSGFDPC